MWKTGKLQQSRTIVPATTTPFHRHAFSVSCLCSPPTRSLVFSVTVRSTDRSLSSSSHHHNDCFSQDFIQGVMVQAFRITPKEVRAALNAASDVSKQKTAIKAALIGVQHGTDRDMAACWACESSRDSATSCAFFQIMLLCARIAL